MTHDDPKAHNSRSYLDGEMTQSAFRWSACVNTLERHRWLTSGSKDDDRVPRLCPALLEGRIYSDSST